MRKTLIPFAASTALLAAASGALAAQTAHVDLVGLGGKQVGAATLTEAPNGVLMRVEAKGLPPGWHGLHFHETGDCSKPDFSSAGAHIHAMPAHVHGLLNPAANEAGDLPNLFVSADGAGQAEFFTAQVSLTGQGARAKLLDADGAALVVHASADDHQSQPIGGAGGRIACGVIR